MHFQESEPQRTQNRNKESCQGCPLGFSERLVVHQGGKSISLSIQFREKRNGRQLFFPTTRNSSKTVSDSTQRSTNATWTLFRAAVPAAGKIIPRTFPHFIAAPSSAKCPFCVVCSSTAQRQTTTPIRAHLEPGFHNCGSVDCAVKKKKTTLCSVARIGRGGGRGRVLLSLRLS